MDISKLIQEAIEIRNKAYAPYSNFLVGAALLSASSKIYTGCNIENASYTPSNCAERTAFFKAVSEGEKHFKAIAVVGAKRDDDLDFCPPCGVCRQVMMEFCNPKEFEIIVAKSVDEYKVFTLEEILPMGFGPNNL